MRTGKVIIDFEKMKQEYPLAAIHILHVLEDKKNVTTEIHQEDSRFIEPAEGKHRVQFSYEGPKGDANSFTLMIEEEFIRFTTHP